MSFVSGPVTAQCLNISGAFFDEVTDRLVDAIGRYAFGQSPMRPDKTQLGWTGPGHLFETEILAERIAYGPFAHVALRIDRLNVPPNIMRAYVRVEEEAALAAGGRAFLGRAERKQAREAASLRAEREMKAGRFRQPNAYPVLIDLAARRVYLGTPTPKVGDTLAQLFADTFGCELRPLTPQDMAARVTDQAGRARAFENLTPFVLAAPAGEAADAGRFEADLRFLGKEFLTWLWFQTDADAGPLRTRAGDEVSVAIDRSMRLKCDFDLTGTDVITADNPANLPEARAALKIGKQPTRMGLVVGSSAGEFRLTLDGLRWAISGLVLPEDDGQQDPSARAEHRFELVRDAMSLLEAMFELFILARTGREWERTLREMTAWAGGAARRSRRASA